MSRYNKYYWPNSRCMDISMFLAQAFGLYLVIGGVALLARPKVMHDIIDLFARNEAAVMMGGFLSLVVGIPLVLVHSVWDGPLWQTIVTVLVWLTFLKGLVRVLVPGMVLSWGNAFKRNTGALKVAVIVMLLVGLYLCYVSFGIGM